MRLLIIFIACFNLAIRSGAQDSVVIKSPDKKISVTVKYKDRVSYTIHFNDQLILHPSFIDLELVNGPRLTSNLRGIKTSTRTVNSTIISPVPEKRRSIADVYNQLTITFKHPYSLVFRVYNDGVAYRIQTRFQDSIVIKKETATFALNGGEQVYFPQISKRADADRYHTSFEELYPVKSIDSLNDTTLAYTPVLTAGSKIKMAITESDLEDYPGMFLSGSTFNHSNNAGKDSPVSPTGSNALQGVFAPYPLEETMTAGEFPQSIVTKRADYIARTNGTRSLPWRVIIISQEDKELPSNDIVYRLASPSRIKDPSWISPGKGTDEWIIGINLFNVPFKSGVNTATYKFYIDFVKQFGFDRIMMDAGWSNYKDLFDINPNINMDTIAAYANSKGIKLSMWTLNSTLERQLDSALKQFNKWGVDFIMTDFMDRDDQPMVNFFHRTAKACADHKIMIMYHGAFPPKGFNRTWPNAVTREGVLGSEYNIWSDKVTPEHNVTLAFTRMLAGPLDYEPGFLHNVTKDQFRPIAQQVMSMGTRCHQLSMFVVYESPIQLFSGNPSQAMREPEFMKLLGSIPTTWDETRIIEAKVSDYLITARKKGNDWFIAGMTDWTSREFSLNLDFLDDKNYTAELCADGINAETYPADYNITRFNYQKADRIDIKMAPGGGFLLKLTRQQ